MASTCRMIDEKYNSPVMPEEHLFRLVAGRGAAPLDRQMTLMKCAITALEDKLSQLQDRMKPAEVAQIKQAIMGLTDQCSVLNANMEPVELEREPKALKLRSSLNAKAAPFVPSGASGASDSTGWSSEREQSE